MNRKFAAAIAVACILAALAAAGSIAYRVVSQGAAGSKVAEADFERLLSALSEVRTASDLVDPGLRGRLAAHFSACPALLAVEVFERGVGTRWRIPADSPYTLGVSGEGAAKLPSSIIRLTSPLRSDTTGALAVDALYVRVTQLTAFTAFRDALIALAAFLALASIALAAASRPRRGGPSADAAEAASAAAAYQYETLSSGWDAPPSEPRPAAPPKRRESAPVESAPVESAPAEDAAVESAPAVGEEPDSSEVDEYEAPDFGVPAPSEAEAVPEVEFEAGPEAPSAKRSAVLEPDYLEHAEAAEEDFFLAREEGRERAGSPSKGFFDDEAEDEFDIPEIDFKEDDRPRPSAFETKLDEPLPDMDMPSDDWMSANAPSSVEEEAPAEAEKPRAAAPFGAGAAPIADIEELEAFDLEPPAPAREPSDASSGPAAGPGAGPGAVTAMAPELRLAGRLATEIFEAASSGKDLSLLIVEHEELTPAVREYSRFAKAVQEHFEAGDLAFERGAGGFAVVLPGADSRKAVELADGLLKSLNFLSGGDSKELQFVPLFVGISSRASRPVAADRLIAEADAALRKAKEDMESHIVAFRPDPGRFKDYMSTRER
jgi:hypothetical protein